MNSAGGSGERDAILQLASTSQSTGKDYHKIAGFTIKGRTGSFLII